MKNLVIVIVVLAVAWFGGRWAVETFGSAGSSDLAKRRVDVVLAGLKSGGDEEAAISMWYRGVMVLPKEELEAAVDPFATWRGQKELMGAIGSGSVDSIDTSGTVPVAKITIDGRHLAIRVPDKTQMSWADSATLS